MRKRKLNAAGRALAADWAGVVQRHERWPKFHKGPPPAVKGEQRTITDAQEQTVAPKATFVAHGGTAQKPKVYTGDKVIGIAVMHKSNLVPVFNQQQAEETAKMRRG